MGKGIKKIKDLEQHDHEDEEERGIVKDMANGVSEHFDNNNDHCTTQ